MNNKPETIKNNSLPGPLSLLGETWKLYRRNFKTLTVLSLVAYFSSFISSILPFLGGISFKSSPALYILINIVAIAISFGGVVAILYTIKDEKNGVNIREALTKGLKKLFLYFWVLCLDFFITFGGFILFIVPGILFLVWFSMATFVLVSENVGGMSALLKSREYIRGYFWPVAGRLLSFWIISAIAFWVPDYLFKLIHLPLYLITIYSASISILGTIFHLSYGFLLYKHLKSIKGEITLGPSSKNKAFFIICGVLGAIIPIILIILYLMFAFIIPPNLSASGKPQTMPFDYKLNDSPLVANRKLIQDALEKYYSDRTLYPSSLEELVPAYLSSVPLNPITRKQYNYVLEENGKKYRLCLDESQSVCVHR